jgi:uncharacterized protein (TIGR02145 family)
MNYKIINLFLIVLLSFIFAKCTVENNNIAVEGCPKPSNICEVKIGSQIWMCKNLDVDHYRNGDPIPEVKDPEQWSNLTTGAWCYYDNDSAMGNIYGKLYNWYAVNDPRGLAPEGWLVPSENDWKILELFIGLNASETNEFGWRGNDLGSKLKESGTTHWISPNTSASNETGFSALPCGYRGGYSSGYSSGSFDYIDYYGLWWSAEDHDSESAYHRHLSYNSSKICRDYTNKVFGFSVRCVKDK